MSWSCNIKATFTKLKLFAIWMGFSRFSVKYSGNYVIRTKMKSQGTIVDSKRLLPVTRGGNRLEHICMNDVQKTMQARGIVDQEWEHWVVWIWKIREYSTWSYGHGGVLLYIVNMRKQYIIVDMKLYNNTAPCSSIYYTNFVFFLILKELLLSTIQDTWPAHLNHLDLVAVTVR